jgi:alpha-glucoside transport system substrate-binding protein
MNDASAAPEPGRSGCGVCPTHFRGSSLGRALLGGFLLALVAASCSSTTTSSTTTSTTTAVPDTIRVMGSWIDDEQAAFQQVLDGFTSDSGIPVEYYGIERDLPSVLRQDVADGDPPDVALFPTPGLLQDLVAAGAAVPIEEAAGALVDANFAPVWRELGSVDGMLYAVFFKAANKSTVWYDADRFEEYGIEPPLDWGQWIAVNVTLRQAGITPLALAGADGWVLSDWFENVYLHTAGPDRYDQLTNHEIPWTDPSVKEALTLLGAILTDENVARGRVGAAQVTFQESIAMVFGEAPEAAMVFEGDFVAGFIESETGAEPGEGFSFFEFPTIDESPRAVVGGGDLAVQLRDNPGAAALMAYLATPEAAEIWAALGGFSSPNRHVAPEAYPSDVTRASAFALAFANEFRFDLSDLVPAALGSTRDAGIWGRLQDWLANPDDVDQILERLEQEATAAYQGT